MPTLYEDFTRPRACSPLACHPYGSEDIEQTSILELVSCFHNFTEGWIVQYICWCQPCRPGHNSQPQKQNCFQSRLWCPRKLCYPFALLPQST